MCYEGLGALMLFSVGVVRRLQSPVTKTALLCFLRWDLSEDVVLLPSDLRNILGFSGTGGFVALLERFWVAPSSCISKNPAIGTGESKYLACLIQSSARYDDSAVMIGLIPARA